MAVTFGLDVSHHQEALDLARCRREGVEFVFLKATEGSSFVDGEFAANLAEARAAGLLVAAYHYVRSNAPAAAQVAHIQRVVPLGVPVILDVELNSGPLPLTRQIVDLLRAAGRTVPLLYLPRWYWRDHIGSPDLRGLPPLWSSRYPDNVVGSIPDEFADVPAHYWIGYGGLPVAVLQFTSSAAIAGHHPIDANAFRGSRAQLAALLGGEQEDDVSWNDQLTFTPPTGSDPVTYSAATWLMWTNWYTNLIPGLVATTSQILAAVTSDEEITPDAIAEMLTEAVEQHTPTVEQIAQAAMGSLAPLVGDVVRAAVVEAGEHDNADLAELIVQKLGAALVEPGRAA